MAVEQNLVVGAGKLYFDRFVEGTYAGTGERFLGNCPNVTISKSSTKLDHFASTGGLRVKDRSVQLQSDMTGTITTDEISPANMALAWNGDTTLLTVAAVAAPGLTQTILPYKGRVIQLGASTNEPQGKRKLVTPTVKVTPAGATVATTNYTIDLELGRITILDDAPNVIDGTTSWDLTFGQTAYTRQSTIAKGQTIYGALRFIADNPVGDDKDVFAPYVELTADGDFAWIGETWQEMQFTLEILKLAGLEKLYIDGRPQ